MKMEWISVTDKLPNDGETVLVVVRRYSAGFLPMSAVEMASYSRDFDWVFDDAPVFGVIDITHWMPLPEPPKEEST